MAHDTPPAPSPLDQAMKGITAGTNKMNLLSGAAQVASIAASISSDPVGYFTKAVREPDSFRKDMGVIAANLDNPLVQAAGSKALLAAAEPLTRAIPGGDIGQKAAESLTPKILEAAKTSGLIDQAKNVAKALDVVAKSSPAQDAMQTIREPAGKAAEAVQGFLPAGLSAKGMSELKSAIGDLTRAMNTKFPEMLQQTITDFGSKIADSSVISNSAKSLTPGVTEVGSNSKSGPGR